ncbi:MAG: glycosyltransferase, partial [Candidatus Woesearchaeota archaeon]
MERISIIIPTYNEAGNIKKLIDGITKAYKNSEIIIVDDNSPDMTWDIARKL